MFDIKLKAGHSDIFHGQVILPYNLRTICCMNMITWDDDLISAADKKE